VEDADEFIDGQPHRVVDNAVGFQGEQRIDVIGRNHPDTVDADQLADVDTDLRRRPREAPHELEGRVRHDRLDRLLADVACRPLHHLDRHELSIQSGSCVSTGALVFSHPGSPATLNVFQARPVMICTWNNGSASLPLA
jgi:hypothetical protein